MKSVTIRNGQGCVKYSPRSTPRYHHRTTIFSGSLHASINGIRSHNVYTGDCKSLILRIIEKIN